MCRVPGRGLLDEISPYSAGPSEVVDEVEDEDALSDAEIAMHRLVTNAFKYMTAQGFMEKYLTSVGYEFVVVQLTAHGGQCLNGLQYARYPALLAWSLAMCMTTSAAVHDRFRGPGQPNATEGGKFFDPKTHGLVYLSARGCRDYYPEPDKQLGFCTDTNLALIEQTWEQVMGDLPKALMMGMDGMTIKWGLCYDKRTGAFVGCMNQPTAAEISAGTIMQKQNMARQAIQLMGWSPDGKRRYRLGNVFSTKSIDPAWLAAQLVNATEKLEVHGARVVGLVNDNEGALREAARRWRETMQIKDQEHPAKSGRTRLLGSCEEHGFKNLRNALNRGGKLCYAAVESEGSFFNMDTLGSCVFSDDPEISASFEHLSKEIMDPRDAMHTAHASKVCNAATIAGLDGVLRRMDEQNGLRLPGASRDEVAELRVCLNHAGAVRACYRDSKSVEEAIAAVTSLVEYHRGTVEQVKAAREAGRLAPDGSALTAQEHCVSSATRQAWELNLKFLQDLKQLLETDPDLMRWAGRLNLRYFGNTNVLEGEFSFHHQVGGGNETAKEFTLNSTKADFLGKIYNSGVLPVTVPYAHGGSYTLQLDPTPKVTPDTELKPQQFVRKHRVTTSEAGAATAGPVARGEVTQAEVDAYVKLNREARAGFGKELTLRQSHAKRRRDESGTATGSGEGTVAGAPQRATLQTRTIPNNGATDDVLCSHLGCPHRLEFDDVCDDDGNFKERNGYGLKDSTCRLPDLVMIKCDGRGCNVNTHLYHLGDSRRSHLRRAAELAIRAGTDSEWYCKGCSAVKTTPPEKTAPTKKAASKKAKP